MKKAVSRNLASEEDPSAAATVLQRAPPIRTPRTSSRRFRMTVQEVLPARVIITASLSFLAVLLLQLCQRSSSTRRGMLMRRLCFPDWITNADPFWPFFCFEQAVVVDRVGVGFRVRAPCNYTSSSRGLRTTTTTIHHTGFLGNPLGAVLARTGGSSLESSDSSSKNDHSNRWLISPLFLYHCGFRVGFWHKKLLLEMLNLRGGFREAVSLSSAGERSHLALTLSDSWCN